MDIWTVVIFPCWSSRCPASVRIRCVFRRLSTLPLFLSLKPPFYLLEQRPIQDRRSISHLPHRLHTLTRYILDVSVAAQSSFLGWVLHPYSVLMAILLMSTGFPLCSSQYFDLPIVMSLIVVLGMKRMAPETRFPFQADLFDIDGGLYAFYLL